MKISSNELRAILEEVEAELEPLLRSEKDRLSKAVGDEEGSSPSASSASPMGQEASKSPGRDMLPEEKSGGPVGGGEESPALSPGGEASPAGAPEGADEGGEAGAEGQVEALAAEYAKLPPEELEMHLMALQAAMQKLGGGAEGSAGGSPAGSPAPAGPEASPALKKELSASPEASKAKKAEKSVEKSYTKKEKSAEESSKSESSEKSSPMSKSEFDALNAKVDVALKAVEFLTRPMRKAVTEAADAPSKSWSRPEVTEKLKAVTANPSLAKSDRQLVNEFYDGRVSLDRIAHLLK